MPLTIIRSSPSLDAYTHLSVHQSRTPESFSTPVLHFRCENSKLLLAREQIPRLPIFGNGASENDGESAEKVFEGVDVWVTSENVIIFIPSSSSGVQLPYTSITLHAIQRVSDATGIYMQISLSPSFADTLNPDAYDDEDLLELTIIPLPQSDELTNAFFKALSDCSNLHPDASGSSSDAGDEDPILFEGGEGGSRLEGFPEGLGEGGWITAENVDQFRFEDVPEGDVEHGMVVLGPGAGTVRLRDEEEPSVEEVNGGEREEETKWRRTD